MCFCLFKFAQQIFILQKSRRAKYLKDSPFPIKEVKCIFPWLMCGLHTAAAFKSITLKGVKRVTSWWRSLTKVLQSIDQKANTLVISQRWQYVPLTWQEENHTLFLWSVSKTKTPGWETYQTQPNRGESYSVRDQYSSGLSRSTKARKVWVTVTAKQSLKKRWLLTIAMW